MSSASQSKSLGPLKCESWLYQLVHYEYEDDGKSSYSQHYNNRLAALIARLPSRAKVKNVTLYKIDLEQIKGIVDVLSHQFIQVNFFSSKDRLCVDAHQQNIA